MSGPPNGHEAPRPRCERDILTPSSESTINLAHHSVSSSKKRKRGVASPDEETWQSFRIKPHPSTAFDKPQALTPLLLLPRSRLPLAFLDTGYAPSALPSTRLFAAQVGCLELSAREHGTVSAPMVLVAQTEIDRSLVAVERVDRGRYAICKLGSWVKLDELRSAATLVREEARPSSEVHQTVQEHSGRREVAKVDNQAARPRVGLKRTRSVAEDGMRSLTKAPIESSPCLMPLEGSSTPNLPPQQAGSPSPALPVVDSPREIPGATAEPNAQETFNMIRTAYMEALYISKTSLAYFAKGPLSRARAGFLKDEESSMVTTDLVTFLKDSVLSLTAMDKKYRDSIPSIIQALPPEGISDEDHVTAAKVAKKKTRKVGSRKGGLYAEEKGYVAKWWRGQHEDPINASFGEARSDMMKKRIASLRTRETKLQIVLVFEVLALQESSLKGKGVQPAGDGQDTERKDVNEGRAKKSQNLDLTLELLVDRLCIWQSVDNESLASSSMGASTEQAGNGLCSGASVQEGNHDNLREFCMEVIVTFYAARLPKQCAAVSRKLGGPNLPSPLKPSVSKATNVVKSVKRRVTLSKRPSLPGKPRRTLERVLTDERLAQNASRRSNLPLSLTRSVTAPAVPGLKREGSQIPLDEVPTRDSQAMRVSRSGVLNSKRFHQREIDLGDVASRNDLKAKKNSQVQDELKGTITALKKPNRGLAVKDYVESCERRTLSGGPNNNRTRRSLPTVNMRGLQVEATPRGKHQMRQSAARFAKEGFSVDGSCIPSSTSHPSHNTFMHSPETTRTLPALPASSVQDTPCRRASKSKDASRGSYDEQERSLNVQDGSTTMTTTIVSETPSHRASKRGGFKVARSIPISISPTEPAPPQEVEAKVETETGVERGEGEGEGEGDTKVEEKSIYESLGWADDELDELA